MRLLYKRGTGGIKNSQKVKSAFFDCFYVMPPLKKGVHYIVVDQIISELYTKSYLVASVCSDINIRLYGGWDELINDKTDNIVNQASIKAQDLTSFILQFYPVRNTSPNYRIKMELSHSLAIRPKIHFPFTYRKREKFSRLRTCEIDDACCEEAKTTITYLRALKKKSHCPNCETPSSDIVWMAEQKLVDTMLTMDLTYYAKYDPDALLVIVSDDDDFFPAIFQQCFSERTIFHVQKSPGKCSAIYSKLVTNDHYISIHL